MKLRLGTRGSDLALWQARHVAERLRGRAEVEIVVLKTRGDRIDDVPLTQVEGKAFFTAEIERALLDGDVDLAVHSHKDLPTEGPPGLQVVAVPARADAAELLLALPAAHDPDAPLLPLRRGARVGTSSPRRAEQLLALRPDLVVQPMRGNVPTRVQRLREARHDAILLARAGVERLALDLAGLHATRLSVALLVPAPAQGALAVQIREGEPELAALLRDVLHDPATHAAIEAERWLLASAGGGCNLPLGAHAELNLEDPDGLPWRVTAFLGTDHPEPGVPARWVRGYGPTPDLAARNTLALLQHGRSSWGPLIGQCVALAGRQTGRLRNRLEQLGGDVRHEAVIEVQELPAPELAARVAALGPGEALVVTSSAAAGRLAGLQPAPGVLVAAVGPATAEALRAAGLRVDIVGHGGARDLARELPLSPGARVLFPCAEDARPDLAEVLTARAVHVEALPLYRCTPATLATPWPCDVRVYMSPSAVQACVALGLEDDPSLPRLAWGDATAAALSSAGLACAGNARAELESLVALLVPLNASPAPEVPQ